MTTTRELYTVVAVDADGETINRWTDLTEDAAKAIKTTMESGTASDLECHINPQERITRSQVYVELGRNGLPSPLEISFSDEFLNQLRVRLSTVEDFDAWAEAYAVRVIRRGIRHVDTIQCSGYGSWRGWDLHLDMCIRVEEPPAEAVAAAILTPDSPELPADEPFAGPSLELVAEVAKEDAACECGHVADDHTKQGDCMRGGCECVDSPTRPSAVSLGFFDDPDEDDEDDDDPLIPAMRLDELEQICQDAREAAVVPAAPAAISDEQAALGPYSDKVFTPQQLADWLNDNPEHLSPDAMDMVIQGLPQFERVIRYAVPRGDGILAFALKTGEVIEFDNGYGSFGGWVVAEDASGELRAMVLAWLNAEKRTPQEIKAQPWCVEATGWGGPPTTIALTSGEAVHFVFGEGWR